MLDIYRKGQPGGGSDALDNPARIAERPRGDEADGTPTVNARLLGALTGYPRRDDTVTRQREPEVLLSPSRLRL